MLRKILKHSTTKLDTNSKTFTAVYDLLKIKWLKEQINAKSLSKAEQNQVSSPQNAELLLYTNLVSVYINIKYFVLSSLFHYFSCLINSFLILLFTLQLIVNYSLDETQTSRQFPLSKLTDNDLKLELPSYEKELDEAFRKEIGKVIPYLREFTVTGIENYIRRLDRAMFSLAKNNTRKEILDKLAAPYLFVLINKDTGLIKSYYDCYLLSQDSDENNTLTSTR